MQNTRKTNWPINILVALGTIVILFPLYMALTIALKDPQQMAQSLFGLPTNWRFDNFANAIEVTNFFQAFRNSVLVTTGTVVLTLLTNSMVAYAIGRNMQRSKFFKGLYFYFVSAMFIPFPIIMLPIVKLTASLHMTNLIGLTILHTVYALAFNVFVYVGYIRSIPVALEEAATVDGASTWGTFWRIIFPLMAPINATVGILVCLSTYNDFLLPLIIISDQNMYTLPLVQYIFQGQFNTDYNLAFASYLLAMLPMIIIYLFAQKWIISGVTRGSVK